MIATWIWILSVLVYFQETTAGLLPVSLQNAPKCEGLRCHGKPQYMALLPQYLLQPQHHQEIQQAQYQLPVVLQNSQPKCPYGHSLGSLNLYDSNDQHKLLQNLQSLYTQVQYHNQGQTQQQEGYQASYQQLQDAQQQKLQVSFQQSDNGYQQLDNHLQQNVNQASYQNENNGYLPPRLPQQQISNDLYQTGYQSSQKESQNSFSSSQINQESLFNTNVQNNYESLRQQFNNAHLSSQIQQQQLLNANIQQNEHIKTELSQEHHGKIKQSINYNINHQHQGYNKQEGHLNSYSNAQSSTNIEQHHDIHDQSEGKDGYVEQTEAESDKHKEHHDAYYKFQYAVNDQHTGDIKNHKEERNGDEVRGEYSLVEKDGNVRTVKYIADWKNGFHATVHNSKPRN